MAHNTPNYGWPSRSSQPLQPSSMAMEQPPFSQPQGLSSHPAYPIGYNSQHHPASQSYYQAGAPSGQYFSPAHTGAPHNRHHPRSASIPYSFPSNSIPTSSTAMQDQLFTSPPSSYLVHQSEYYLAQGSSLSSTAASLAVSPQPQPIVPSGPVYSSPDSAPAPSDPEQQVRVISFRPKPQCWDHGCNGREFSTFSNLLRHQREKSGVVAKAECPSCGAVFTRTTARNIHVAQGKCKGIGRDSSN
ncbi:hypothetical protein P175DRAFT_0506121 [Aspergillus ochraceoroseus IBT 24754]|uniref:C2H2-type domain-containing protein n=3 Tax=Aspergillus subgen. Nidulantes TaxID=2720870 RepID=A0A0F8V440_9EURO|nr:uncharacterized protein P175DRAFT_0506121 [Aspergillus ochraceoroseus IBT 24754]KKK19477.1 hypothetical protein AOCH_006497 [Aspergillus ochraceoroseus]KKK26529.1 hypothetical protein ARAM_006129 [Aspergillus rambellii]PTU24470.1 hypothetical protein P175DRAFT_0506121 [Aspergillus ochraceoroseus IBT 24754]